jgi:hypothetical protein
MREFEPTNPVWIIIYEDADVPNSIFVGPDAEQNAADVYEKISNSWNASMFKQVSQNFQPDRP